MKKALILIFCISIFYVNSISQTVTFTPNGKPVSNNGYWSTYPYSTWNQLIAEAYPQNVVIDTCSVAMTYYNCHFFAWHNNQGYEVWNSEDDVWKNGLPSVANQHRISYPTDFYTDANYSKPSGYASWVGSSTKESESAIAVYYEDGSITHSARLLYDQQK